MPTEKSNNPDNNAKADRNDKSTKSDKSGKNASARSAKNARISAKNAKLERVIMWENRALRGAFVVGILGTFLFLIAFSTQYWIYVHMDKWELKNDTRGTYFKEGHYHGLWRICREEQWYIDQKISNETKPYLYCRPMWFALPAEISKSMSPARRAVEFKMIDFRRSTISVGFIAMILSLIAHVFTLYSLDKMRYMFKRLAGCLHLITGASCWVTLEVFRQMHLYEERAMKEFVPEFSDIHFGWSYNLVWVVLILFLVPGVVLLVCSRKRKGRKARSIREAQENEPVNLGRI